MSDFNEPTNTSLYSGIWATVRGLVASCVKLDPSSDTNLPTGAMRLESTFRGFQRWSGSAWVDYLPGTENWTPSYGAAGSMTYTSVTTDYAKYFKFGKWIIFRIKATGTTGGTASNYVTFSLPTAPATAAIAQFSAMIFDTSLSGDVSLGHAFNLTGSTVGVFNFNNSNWGLGTGRSIYVSGLYEVSA